MLIEVKLHPGSKKTEVKKLETNLWEIWTVKQPVNNQANKEAARIIAKELGVAISRVELIRGNKGRQKLFEVTTG